MTTVLLILGGIVVILIQCSGWGILIDQIKIKIESTLFS